MGKLKCFERPHKTKNVFCWKNTVVLFPRDACTAVISAWVYCGVLIWMSLNGIVKCCLFSIRSIKCTKHSHLSPYRNVAANNNDHLTKSEEPICPTGSRKGTLYFSFSGLYLLFWFMTESLGHFYPLKKWDAVSQWNMLLSPHACMWRSLVCQTYSSLLCVFETAFGFEMLHCVPVPNTSQCL